jgi:uncharacterized protein YwgA/O-acetyl-ADP-ribose deacetylase (regulator of RNase III)
MSSFNVTLREGNLLDSSAQTLVNTVNCVGIMGKGIAQAFKRRYPDMFEDYVRRCERREVRLGRPYPYQAQGRLIINFPTKDHWRSVSRLQDIVAGLEHLKENYQEWGVKSLAVPPLGCGNGQLDWEVVGPTLIGHLSEFDVPVELYVPHGVSPQLELLAHPSKVPPRRFVEPKWVAVAALLAQLERQPYHWPVGRVFFQKLVYFADAAGVPTGLTWERGSYGPYASDLKGAVARLQNNGLLVEQRRGRVIEVKIGPTYQNALEADRPTIQTWAPALRRTLDLAARLDTSRAEVAATVHFATKDLASRLDRKPTITDVIGEVEHWKIRRKPPLQRSDILTAVLTLATQGWIDVKADGIDELPDDYAWDMTA